MALSAVWYDSALTVDVRSLISVQSSSSLLPHSGNLRYRNFSPARPLSLSLLPSVFSFDDDEEEEQSAGASLSSFLCSLSLFCATTTTTTTTTLLWCADYQIILMARERGEKVRDYYWPRLPCERLGLSSVELSSLSLTTLWSADSLVTHRIANLSYSFSSLPLYLRTFFAS